MCNFSKVHHPNYPKCYAHPYYVTSSKGSRNTTAIAASEPPDIPYKGVPVVMTPRASSVFAT